MRCLFSLFPIFMQLKQIRSSTLGGWLLALAFTWPCQAYADAAGEENAPKSGSGDKTASAESARGGAQEQNPANQFDLWELRIKGAVTLEKGVVERTIYPFLGPHKTLDDVDKARAALEHAYHAQGFQTVAVDIPEQDVKNGVVYLQVVEGKITRLRVKDSRYFSLGKIKEAIPELAEGNVPNMPKMQKQLADLAAQSPDRQIQPVLRAGDTPGTLEVDLKVKDELPLHARVELNGRNTSTTSRLRLVNSLRYDNLWQQMHSASVMYQVSPENNSEVDVWAGTYAIPLAEQGSRLVFYGVSSNSSSQVASAGATTVIGNGDIFGARYVTPFKALETYFHSATLGMDYKHFKEDLKVLNANGISTPITYMPFLAQYSGNLRGKDYTGSMDLAMHFGVSGIVSDPAQFENKRHLAKADFMYLTGDFKYQYDLPYGMLVKTHIAGQTTNSPLISNEQFSLGGATTVRGYFETQALADEAVLGSLEFLSPHLAPLEWDFLNRLKASAFVDAARGWVISPLAGNPKGYDLYSAGFGFSFSLWKKLSGALDLGFPFVALAPVKSGEPRMHFSVVTEF